jgi:hypothetical protein
LAFEEEDAQEVEYYLLEDFSISGVFSDSEVEIMGQPEHLPVIHGREEEADVSELKHDAVAELHWYSFQFTLFHTQ